MYKYKYVTINVGLGGNLKEDYETVISDYSKRGYRFVSAIPLRFSVAGPTMYDFVFEKEKK